MLHTCFKVKFAVIDSYHCQAWSRRLHYPKLQGPLWAKPTMHLTLDYMDIEVLLSNKLALLGMQYSQEF